MGNTAGILEIKFPVGKQSKESKCNDEAPLFVAGETIRGCVCVDFSQIESSFAGKNVEFQIKVALTGKERSKIVVGPAARKAERPLLFQQRILQEVKSSDIWTPQWHEFQFELDIPPSMPGSLRCEEGRGSYGELEYKVSASLEGPGLRSSRRRALASPGIKKERKISIRAAPIPIIVVPYMMQPMSHEIKTFGVKRIGHIMFGAFVADTHVGPNEHLQICVACRNFSTVDIEDVYFRLVETISWKLDDLNQTKSVERVLVEKDAPMPIPAPKDLWYYNSIESEVGHEEDSYVSLYHELKARKTNYSVQVPSRDEISDDYAGPLVRCTHHLEIRIKTEDHVDDPRVRIPLQLKQFTSFEESPNQTVSRALSKVPQVEDGASVHHTSYLSERTCVRDEIEGILEANYSSSCLNARLSDTSSATEQFGDISFNPGVSLPATNGEDAGINPADDTGTSIIPTLIAGGRVKLVPAERESSSDISSVEGGASFSTFQQDDMPVLPSFEALLDEMLVSVDDFHIVCSKLDDPEWQPIFYQLTPEEFGTMIAHVNLDHDQPKVAAVVAGQIYLESKFTSEHIAFAVKNAADWVRTALVQQLLPFCTDCEQCQDQIADVLSPWELMVLANDFEEALERQSS